MEFIPGISLGNVTFTMSVQDVEGVMGPDGVIETSESGDVQLSYYDGALSFVFYKEDDLKLSNINVQRGVLPVEYEGKNLFDIPFDDIIDLFSEVGEETDHSFEVFDDIGEVETIEFETLGISLYFDVEEALLEVNLFEIVEA